MENVCELRTMEVVTMYIIDGQKRAREGVVTLLDCYVRTHGSDARHRTRTCASISVTMLGGRSPE